jgi:Icc-related predicted phosphoesterase
VLFKRQKRTRIYFASDIHGSERCWRKFLNAGKFYDVDILIMGGDITGKIIVPIVKRSSRFSTAQYMGSRCELTTESEIETFEQGVREHGHYPVRLTEEEMGFYATEERQDELFEQVMVASLSRWMELAEERLKGSGIRCYVVPGNDDIPAVDDVIAQSDYVVNPEGQCVALDKYHELIASGYSNPTPWDTYRELPEDELGAKLEALFSQASSMETLVACMHAPPFGSGLDAAPMLEDDLKVSQAIGHVKFAPVGSKAVAEVIKEHQPMLTLHGHIHESRGVKKIGRTVVINPGSEYTEGILAGAIVEIDEGRVRRRQLVSG